MTESQAYQFWSEWTALKSRWGIENVYATIDETCNAQFPDGSTIDIDGRSLSVGDLKSRSSPIPVAENLGCAIETQVGSRTIRFIGRTPEDVMELRRLMAAEPEQALCGTP